MTTQKHRLLYDPRKIRIQTAEPTISNLIQRMKLGEIDLSPGFQRNSNLWKVPQKSRLIESILVKIPLPAFYVDATDDSNWIVIDGLQRLTILREYVIEKSFVLSDLEFLDDCVGKNFDQLDRMYQRRIEETQITVSKIEEGTNDQIKYALFRRINTGGLPLSQQEIRHALNQGRITDFLKKLSDLKPFFGAPWNKKKKNRMEDRECILRFLSFYHYGVEKYPGDRAESDGTLDGFLNYCMKLFNNETDKVYENLKRKFITAMDTATAIFGENAFCRPSRPLNKAMFETWSVEIARLSKTECEKLVSKKEGVYKKFLDLLETDKKISDSFTSGTGQVGRVKCRFKAVRELILQTIEK